MEKLSKVEVQTYSFKLLWSKSCIGIAVDHQYTKNLSTPLTSFYFWPREDGWKLLKDELKSKPWMEEKKSIEILNAYREIVIFWLTNVEKNMSWENLDKPPLDLKIIGNILY